MTSRALLLVAILVSGASLAAPDNPHRGKSWVVSDPQVSANLLMPHCSRVSPVEKLGAVTGFWIPTPAHIRFLEESQAKLRLKIARPELFHRQYVGIVYLRRKLIYINAFDYRQPDDSLNKDMTRLAMVVCDGGPGYWSATFDPASGKFANIAFTSGW